jgi:hypothetical protein
MQYDQLHILMRFFFEVLNSSGIKVRLNAALLFLLFQYFFFRCRYNYDFQVTHFKVRFAIFSQESLDNFADAKIKGPDE